MFTFSSVLRPYFCLSVLLALLGLANRSNAQIFLFDFGSATFTTEHAASPEDPNYYWNNIPESIGTSTNGQLLNLVTADNVATPFDFVVVSRFNGSNLNGTTNSALFPPESTRDSLFGNTEIFNNLTNIFPSFRLTSLDPNSTYNFIFYASRTGVGDNRETGYTVQGATTAFTALNAANNTNQTASVENIAPDATGSITISLAPTANNNNGSHFTYLGVMKMIAVPPQTPVTFTLEPVNKRVAANEAVSFTAAVQGSQPLFAQWLSNGIAIPGANQFTYTIPVATLDMDGSLYSINVSNMAFSVTSSNALLRVVTDTNPPTIVSVSSPTGLRVFIEFNELVEPNSAGSVFSYEINDGILGIQGELLPDGKTAAITLETPITGEFVVKVFSVYDLAGNETVPGLQATGRVPDATTQSLLFDFGGVGSGATTDHAPAPNDDPVNYWNNLTEAVGQTDDGVLTNLVTVQNVPVTVTVSMLRRFNGFNASGTTAPAPFPTDATRDSLFGNTEIFGLENIFPSFKLTGLNQSLVYTLTFYASRAGVTDNRETKYTVEGATTATAFLNVANNITNVVVVTGMAPNGSGEIIISLSPGPNNNNANHFTYLGVLKVDPARASAPRLLPPLIAGGNVTLEWIGSGSLEWAPTVVGPWNPVSDPPPASGYSEPLTSTNRFFRINATQ